MNASLAPPVPGERKRRADRLDAQLAPVRATHRRALACTVLGGWLLLPQAWAIATIAQAVFVDGIAPETLGVPFLVLLLAMLARAVLARIAQGAAATATEAVKDRLRVQLARHALARGPLWLRTRRKGTLVELSMAQVDALDGYYAGYLPARAEVMWVPAALLIAVFAADWVAGLLLLFTAPLVPLFQMLVGWGAEAAGRSQLQALARAGAHFGDRLRGLDLVRVHGRGAEELQEATAAADEVRDRSMRVLRIAFLSSAVLEFFASVSVAIVALWFGFRYLGLLGFGPALPADLLYTGLFCLLLAPEYFAPLRRLAAHYHDRANALAAAALVEETLDGLPDASSPPVAAVRSAPVADGGIVAADLALRHRDADAPVLAGLSFALARGERLALVGPSGAGKSSLLEALVGWIPAAEGRLQLPAGARIALAGQRPWIFRGTLADNIRLGDPDADDAAVQAAAEAAQVAQFARRLPQGLETQVGERGVGLSGGEARRVALARTLLRQPDVLLLDEPTAFLDPATEAALLAALEAFARGRTVVVATHSPAVMAWAGRVLRLPNGDLQAFPGGGRP
ncbi:thiol reductant ABC exporter subunit CydD [uncultured Luteimonas sp.]|uniref:thiol reductant ABC exporter subunit CydD n=1 Tax=uncultured Luteimonas sp. TaxID=453144 RepID=UPI0026275A6D|nr:thiol reductant ABC exporter subunit CydD [uncultured Luteimonas sp.]